MANLVVWGRMSASRRTHLEREQAHFMTELGAFQPALRAKFVGEYAEPC
jgi:hypothetical protein